MSKYRELKTVSSSSYSWKYKSICQIQEEAFASFGIASEDESDGESDVESDFEDCDTASVEQICYSLPDESDLLEILSSTGLS